MLYMLYMQCTGFATALDGFGNLRSFLRLKAGLINSEIGASVRMYVVVQAAKCMRCNDCLRALFSDGKGGRRGKGMG